MWVGEVSLARQFQKGSRTIDQDPSALGLDMIFIRMLQFLYRMTSQAVVSSCPQSVGRTFSYLHHIRVRDK